MNAVKQYANEVFALFAAIGFIAFRIYALCVKFLPLINDKKQPIRALIDSNYDGKIDIIVEDIDRDGKWDFSYQDVDFDGWIDLVGFHPDGKIVPSRYERFTGFLTTSR